MADKILGDITKKLDELNITENTLVIFTSDNGPRQGVYGYKSAGNLRGHKGSIWEGGHRVPFIAKWPAEIEPGAKSDQTITLADLIATATGIIGQELPAGAAEDSYDILPALLGQDGESPFMILRFIIQEEGCLPYARAIGS
jgi:arylsulfatase A-like enzyme